MILIKYFVDLFSCSPIQNAIQDPALKELALKMPSLLLQARAPSTTRSYVYAFTRWKNWAQQYREVTVFPASPIHVALYLCSLVQQKQSVTNILSAFFGISWAHNIAGHYNPCQASIVKNLLEAAKRILGKPITKKVPITADHLRMLVEKFDTPTASLLEIRFLAMCLLAFAGFFRFSELAQISRSDILIHETHLAIFLEKSKTDQYRDGKWSIIARTKNNTCPYNMLLKYFKAANIHESSCNYIFRSLIWLPSKKCFCLRAKDVPITYTRAREIILEKLQAVGLDRKKFGLHSLRAGGATAAANKGIPDRLFKRHGRWASETAKDGYVKDSLSERLKVSQTLGL